MKGTIMRRRISYIAVAVAAITTIALAGCSATSGKASSSSGFTLPPKAPTATITVMSIDSLGTPNFDSKVVAAFEKQYPTIKIKWQVVPFNNLNSAEDTAIANEQGSPDVYWADQPRIAALASRGEAEDLTSVFSKYKSAFEPSPYSSGVYQGKLWALPIENSAQLLYYNKDLLAKAGIPDPSPAVTNRLTWEQLTSDALKAKNAGAANGMSFGQPNTYYQLEPLPVSLGGSIGATGTNNLTPDFTDAAWVKAMTWYQQLYSSGAGSKGENSSTTDPDFLAGKTAYEVEGTWLLPQLANTKVNWGVAPMPKFAGGKAVTPDGSWSLAMNPFSRNKDASAIFMKWMSITDGSGYIKYSPSTSLSATPEGNKVYFANSVFASPAGKSAATIIDYDGKNTAVNRVSTIGYIEFETIIGKAFSDIQNGADPKATLEKYSAQLTTAWAKYKK
jgi:ABC-type glycerol-3-phosphate transport system substrate-binding protein